MDKQLLEQDFYRWVKASERLPKMETPVYLRINDVMGLGNFYVQDQCYYLYVQRNGAHDEFEKPFSSVVNTDVEWLEKVEAGATSSSTVKELEREVERLKELNENMWKAFGDYCDSIKNMRNPSLTKLYFNHSTGNQKSNIPL